MMIDLITIVHADAADVRAVNNTVENSVRIYVADDLPSNLSLLEPILMRPNH